MFNQQYYETESTKFLLKILEDDLLWHSLGIRPKQEKEITSRERVVYLLYAQAKSNVEEQIRQEEKKKSNVRSTKTRLRR